MNPLRLPCILISGEENLKHSRIPNVLAMGICFRARVRVKASGGDAQEAVAAIASYLDERANCFD